MTRPRLTLAMIVRDEESHLARCLDSVEGLVDEIVVVDTGSTDGTMRVASSRGAKVTRLEWTDDFSAARNRSLEQATHDWVLVLDADEVVQEQDALALERQLDDPSLLALELTLVNEYGRGETRSFRSTRLFRNRPEIRYRFPVHEQVTPSIAKLVRDGQGTTALGPIVVRHFGYTPEMIEQRHKTERNRGILRAYLDSGGDDLYIEYQSVRQELTLVGERVLPKKGLPACMDRLDRVRGRMQEPLPPFAPEIFLRLAQGSLALERTDDAVALVEEGIRRTGDRIYFRFFRALLGSDAAALEECVGRPCVADSFETDDQYGGAYPLTALGQLAFRDGKPLQALGRLRQAMRMAPWYASPHVALGRNELERGVPRTALEHFLAAIKTCPDDPEGWVGAAATARRLGLEDQATRWIATVLEKLPLHGPALALARESGIDGLPNPGVPGV